METENTVMNEGTTSPDGAPGQKGFLAHVRRNDNESFAIHELEEHSRAVGDLSSEFNALL